MFKILEINFNKIQIDSQNAMILKGNTILHIRNDIKNADGCTHLIWLLVHKHLDGGAQLLSSP